MAATDPVLVLGARGFLGRQVVDALLSRGRSVRALVRPGRDAGGLAEAGIEVVRGDMLDQASIERAADGVDAVVHSAIGYTQRGRQARDADTTGNRNVAAALRTAGVRRLVFTGILASEDAPDVPHFHDKVVAERQFSDVGVPYVSLRPGAFLDQVAAMAPGGGPVAGPLWSFGSPQVAMTWVLSAQVAAALAALVDAPVSDGEHIDFGWSEPVTMRQLGELCSDELGHPVNVRTLPWPLLNIAMRAGGLVDSRLRDSAAMFGFFQTGRFVADPNRQAEILGPVPGPREAVASWLADAA